MLLQVLSTNTNFAKTVIGTPYYLSPGDPRCSYGGGFELLVSLLVAVMRCCFSLSAWGLAAVMWLACCRPNCCARVSAHYACATLFDVA
jgi:hypothetical protein